MDRVKRVLVWLLVLGLIAAVAWLQAERNHRTYSVTTKDGAVVVAKGIWFVWGSQPYVPDDPATAEAYEAIPLPEGATPVADQRFGEREALDRFLFDLLAGWAETRIRTDDPDAMREGFVYVDRAARLTGISSVQSKRLRELRAEVAFFEAKDRLEEVAALLDEVREKLKLAAEAGTGHAREATLLGDQLEPAVETVGYVLKLTRLGFRAAGPVAAPVPATGAFAPDPDLPVPAYPPAPEATPATGRRSAAPVPAVPGLEAAPRLLPPPAEAAPAPAPDAEVPATP